jgi:hypothetical protein
MPAPFAALDQRVNSAVERALSNAVASHAGGPEFGVQFGREAVQVFGGDAVDAAQLTVGFIASRAPGLTEGGVLTVDGVPHRVTGDVQPDETGWLTVRVYPVAA